MKKWRQGSAFAFVRLPVITGRAGWGIAGKTMVTAFGL
jgi:hypothetical protein